jgi:hypothetical protein
MRSLKSRLFRAPSPRWGRRKGNEAVIVGGGRPLHGTSRDDDESRHFADKT